MEYDKFDANPTMAPQFVAANTVEISRTDLDKWDADKRVLRWHLGSQKEEESNDISDLHERYPVMDTVSTKGLGATGAGGRHIAYAVSGIVPCFLSESDLAKYKHIKVLRKTSTDPCVLGTRSYHWYTVQIFPNIN